MIDPQDQLGRYDWEAIWEEYGDGNPNDAFAAGFAKGAHDVFEEVKDRL